MLLHFSMLFLWLTLKEWSGKSNKEGQKIRSKNTKKKNGYDGKENVAWAHKREKKENNDQIDEWLSSKDIMVIQLIWTWKVSK